MQLRKEAWKKFRTSTGFEPVTSRYRCTVKLYADDTKLYREIENIPDDTHVLQSDLFRLIEWCKTWQLTFNPDKCKTMRITHKQDKSKESYTLDPNCEILKSMKNIKDLGITISYDLSWSEGKVIVHPRRLSTPSSTTNPYSTISLSRPVQSACTLRRIFGAVIRGRRHWLYSLQQNSWVHKRLSDDVCSKF